MAEKELLAACKAALKLLTLTSFPSEDEWAALVEKLEKAVALAEGRKRE